MVFSSPMKSQYYQVKLNLPKEMKDLLAEKARYFGLSIPAFIKGLLFHEVKQDVMLKIIDIVEGCGAEMAFPTQTLHFAEPLPEPEPEK